MCPVMRSAHFLSATVKKTNQPSLELTDFDHYIDATLDHNNVFVSTDATHLICDHTNIEEDEKHVQFVPTDTDYFTCGHTNIEEDEEHLQKN